MDKPVDFDRLRWGKENAKIIIIVRKFQFCPRLTIRKHLSREIQNNLISCLAMQHLTTDCNRSDTEGESQPGTDQVYR